MAEILLEKTNSELSSMNRTLEDINLSLKLLSGRESLKLQNLRRELEELYNEGRLIIGPEEDEDFLKRIKIKEGEINAELAHLEEMNIRRLEGKK